MIKLILNPHEPDQQEITVNVCEGDIENIMGTAKDTPLPHQYIKFISLVHAAALQMVLSNKVATNVACVPWVLIDTKYDVVIDARRTEHYNAGDHLE